MALSVPRSIRRRCSPPAVYGISHMLRSSVVAVLPFWVYQQFVGLHGATFRSDGLAMRFRPIQIVGQPCLQIFHAVIVHLDESHVALPSSCPKKCGSIK